MSLAEIKDFVDMTKQGDATLESRLAVFRNQRDVVKRQIAELRRRYIKLDVVITSGASCPSSMKINVPPGASVEGENKVSRLMNSCTSFADASARAACLFSYRLISR